MKDDKNSDRREEIMTPTEASASTTTTSRTTPSSLLLERLDDDLLLRCLEFLSYASLNEVACVSKYLQTLRNASPLLDQTREAKIVIKDRDLPPGQRMYLWTQPSIPQNATRVVLQSVQNMWKCVPRELKDNTATSMQVTHLTWKCRRVHAVVHDLHQRFFLEQFPNLEMLCVDKLYVDGLALLRMIKVHCPRLQSLSCADVKMRCPGITNIHPAWHGLQHLKEINLDRTDMRKTEFFTVLHVFAGNKLEYVSCVDTLVSDDDAKLMTFLTNLPNLKWCRSNLSSKKLGMLKEQRPDVTFVPRRSTNGISRGGIFD